MKFIRNIARPRDAEPRAWPGTTRFNPRIKAEAMTLTPFGPRFAALTKFRIDRKIQRQVEVNS